jgi:Spy/CpxP family protein refolding chaperone
MRTGRMAAIALVGGLGLSAVGMWAMQVRAEPASTSSEATAGQPHPARPFVQFLRNHFRRLGQLRAKLDVTDEQRQQIRETLKSHKDELLPLVKELKQKRDALRTAVLADPSSEEAIRSAANDLGKSIGDTAVAASKVAKELKQILTPEQRETLRRFRENRSTAIDMFLDKALAD